jgi:hypothetical protein
MISSSNNASSLKYSKEYEYKPSHSGSKSNDEYSKDQ